MIVIKVLVCGSYQGALQRRLSQRLKKEGCEVFVLTSDSAAEKKPSAVFQDYRFSYESESVMNVMSSVSPDAVIFCGAFDEAFDWSKSVSGSVAYVGGIMNLLSCAAAVKVKKFLCLSSLEVFAENIEAVLKEETVPLPLTQREKALLQGERICLSAFADGEAIKTAVVRLPQVYGVCEKRVQNSICSEIAENVYSGERAAFSKEPLFSLIYLDDAVDAVYKVLTAEQEQVQKLYQIVPQSAVSKEELAEAFACIQKEQEAIFQTEADKKNRFISESQKELGFSEKYTLEKGLPIFWKQYTAITKAPEQREKKVGREQRKWFLPIVETILAFALVQLFLILTEQAAFHQVIDVYLIYVMVIAVVLGAIPSTLAVILSVLGKYALLFLTEHSLAVFTNYENYLWILQLFFLSVLTGYLKDWYTRSVDEMKRENTYLKKEIESLKSINDSNVQVKEVFEKRLVNYKESYAKVSEIISQLDELESKSILFQAAKVAAEVMESKDVAVYTYESKSGFCRLMASTSEFAKEKGKSLRLSDYGELSEKLHKKQNYMNRKLEENMPMFAAGIYQGEVLEAVIMVWSMDLKHVNLHQNNQLTMLSKLMERSMTRALRYMESVKHAAYLPGTQIMEAEAFYKMLDIYCAGEAEGVLEYTMLKVLIYEGETAVLYEKLSRLTRETDYLGVDVEDGVYILLTNADEADAENAISRFKSEGIFTKIVKKKKGKTAEEVFAPDGGRRQP